MQIARFIKEDAAAVCAWCYDGVYAVYNCPSWEIVEREQWGMADPEIRTKEFYSVLRDAQLVGFFRWRLLEQRVWIGLGLRPDCCGRGIGKELMRLIEKEVCNRFPGIPRRLKVRAFHERAIRCYERAGFSIIEAGGGEAPIGTDRFVIMERDGSK